MKPISIFLFLCLPFSAFSKSESQPQQQDLFQKRSLCFTENKGQVSDQNGDPRPDIQYKVRASKGLNIFIGNGQLHYQFSKQQSTADVTRHHPFDEECSELLLYDTYRLDVTLEGANSLALVSADEKQDYYEHYHTARLSDRSGVINTYRRITYKDVYPNIDWVLYIKDNRLEYDFVIRPGGNVSDIKIRYDGASELRESAGAVTAITPFGTITESKLYSYKKEDGKRVAAEFQVSKNTIGFNVEPYNETIVIDPTIVWSTYFGGSDMDVAQNIIHDGNGIYIGGTTHSMADLATVGAHQLLYGGGNDAFVARFTSAGALQWATYYGGPGDENGSDIAADARGNVFIAGSTTSDTCIATSGVYDTVYAGGSDAFLAKFDSAGVLRWGTYIGGNSVDVAYGVGCGDSNMVYLSGSTNSTFAVTTFFAYQTVLGSVKDAFLAKFDSSGKICWSTYYGGDGDDAANDVVFANGKVYLTGNTQSTNQIATPGAWRAAGGGGQWDVFLAQFGNNGFLNWATYYGGNSQDLGYKVAAHDNNIYIAGGTASIDSIGTAGSYQSTNGGVTDGYLAKFNNSGARLWSTYFGGGGQDWIYGLTTDTAGYICIAGQTVSDDSIATPDGYHTTRLGVDAFAAKFSSAGARLWATYFGGSGADWGHGVACDRSQNIYITGETISSDSIATPGSYRTNIHGYSDVFLTKFNVPIVATTTEIKNNEPTEPVLEVWPNPANDRLFFRLSATLPPASVTITDVTGKQLALQAINTTTTAEISISHLSPGIYLYYISTADVRIHTGKFIKE